MLSITGMNKFYYIKTANSEGRRRLDVLPTMLHVFLTRN